MKATYIAYGLIYQSTLHPFDINKSVVSYASSLIVTRMIYKCMASGQMQNDSKHCRRHLFYYFFTNAFSLN